MYFLEQIKTQFIAQLASYQVAEGIEGPSSFEGEKSPSEGENKPSSPEEVKGIAADASRTAREIDADVDRATAQRDRIIGSTPLSFGERAESEINTFSQKHEGLEMGELASLGNEGGEREEFSLGERVISPEVDTQKAFEALLKKSPFDAIPEDERQALYEQIMEEGFEVPEGMTQEEAMEEAMNSRLSEESTEFEERIDIMLDHENIELNDEQRQALSEYLEGIENPTMQDIENFLKENGMTTIVDDNPNTPEDEAGGPNFATRLFSNMDSYSHLPSSRGNYSGENLYTGEVFRGNAGLNEQFYNVEKLRTELSPDLRRQADQLAEKITTQIESQGGKAENWIGALYRNASNNSDFSVNQPVLLHNLSTATALVYINGRIQLCPATHGKGVGNKADSGSTPIGSFQLYAMSNGKYQARMGVKGLETMRQNMSNGSESEAYNMDPASMGNANSDNRLIRVHESRGSRTLGCSGLPTEIAKQLANATRDSRIGIMERFVSNPTG